MGDQRYLNGTIGLDQHMSTSNESIEIVEGNKNSVIKDVGKEVKVYTEDSCFENREESLRDLYHQLVKKPQTGKGLASIIIKRTADLKGIRKLKFDHCSDKVFEYWSVE